MELFSERAVEGRCLELPWSSWHSSCFFLDMPKRPDVRSSLEKTAEKLEQRFAEVEALARENRRILDLQYKRLADMQVDLDRVLSELKRRR